MVKFDTNSNETVKLYDILRQFGAAGLGYVLKYFHDERKAIGDDTQADYCMEDIYWHTQLLTHNEYKHVQEDNHIILDNGTYILIETFN